MKYLQYIRRKKLIEKKLSDNRAWVEHFKWRINHPSYWGNARRYDLLLNKHQKLLAYWRNELKELKEGGYDDNRVYRTGERQLAVRLDRSTVRRKAA